MRNNSIVISDYIRNKDERQFGMNKKVLKTELYRINKDPFGNDVFEYIGENDLLIGGRIFLLEKAFNLTSNVKPPTLNEEFNIENTHEPLPQGLKWEDVVFLFGVGLDGAGEQIGSTKEVDIKSKGFNILDDMKPFRVVDKSNASECDNKYFMRVEKNGKYHYYLKPPKVDPVIRCYFEDGTPVLSDVYTSHKQIPINTYVELHYEINEKDLREIFQLEGNPKACRYNSICLYAGYPVQTSDGRREYKNLRAITKYNCENEPFDTPETTLNFIYRIYTS